MYTESHPVEAQTKPRFLVTMCHRATGIEQTLEVRPERETFVAIAQAVRQRYTFEWEIVEWFDPDTPF